MSNKEIAESITKQWLLECWLNRIGSSVPDQEQVAQLQKVIERELINWVNNK